MTFLLKNIQLHVAQKTICDHFSLTIHPGEIWCILGKNGVGKTSFLHSLCGIKPLTTGAVSYQTTDLLNATPHIRAKTIGLLQQEQDFLFPAKVQDIVLAGRHPHTHKLIGETQADHEITNTILKQLDLDTLSERNITTLSGGERRRAAIGTLLAQAPEIYLLDEPSNHLDIHYQIKILEIFKNLAHDKQKIIIMVTHDLNLAAKYSDKIILFFDDAQIITGDKKTILTAEQLSRLYDHPIQMLSHQQQDYFFA